MMNSIIKVEQLRDHFSGDKVPPRLTNHMRKLSRKKSSHASTRIEDNPLTEEQASQAIDDAKHHFLKPEEEVRNYYAALELLERRLEERSAISTDLLLEV